MIEERRREDLLVKLKATGPKNCSGMCSSQKEQKRQRQRSFSVYLARNFALSKLSIKARRGWKLYLGNCYQSGLPAFCTNHRSLLYSAAFSYFCSEVKNNFESKLTGEWTTCQDGGGIEEDEINVPLTPSVSRDKVGREQTGEPEDRGPNH